MFQKVFSILESAESFFWIYAGIPMLMGLGIYLSYKSDWFQIRQLSDIFTVFKKFLFDSSESEHRGVSPIYAFFASLGGCVGVANVIGVCTAVQLGGPGAVFWIWVTALIGMLVKYGEIYLGVKFRIKDKDDSYFGGPIIYLRQIPGGSLLAPLAAVLLCVYGVEVYMFRMMTHSIAHGLHIPMNIIVGVLLVCVLGIGQGGVRLVGKISTVIIPIFVVGFTGMSLWVFYMNASKIPAVLYSIFVHAFTPHAAVGAFAGSSALLAMSYGVKRACYSADIGIGYASIIHSETSEAVSGKQASMGIIDTIFNIFIISTLSLFVILLTDSWYLDLPEDLVIVHAFKKYFDYVDVVWPVFIFLLSYSSVLAFFSAGRRSAMLLFPKHGSLFYMIFATVGFVFFSYVATSFQCMAVMSATSALLLAINLYGLYQLKDEIVFNLKENNTKNP